MGLWLWPLLCCLHVTLLRGGGSSPQPRPPAPKAKPAPGQEWFSASPAPWAPTPEPDPQGSAAALAFLRSGDAPRLARANCSRRFAAAGPGAGGGGGPPAPLRAALRAAAESLAHAANFLNMLLQANDIREASLAEDAEWYHALVRSLVAGDPRVYRAVLAFDAHPLASKPRLMLQATQESAEILLQDLSAAAGRGNLSGDRRWFDAPEPPRGFSLRKRLLRNDLRSLETPKWSRGDGYVGDAGHVRWSPPFLECRDGKFLPSWMVTLSSSFYGLKPDLSPEFKGVVRLDVKLQDVQLDPCASGPGWFADTHRCDLNSTQESRGFVLGSYLCRCKPGFYGAGGAAGGAGAGARGSSAPAPGGRLACRPCRPGCAACVDDAPCLIEEAGALRAAVLSCQAACMLAVFLSMLVSYHFRKSKRIRASGVILLETILFGSLLLYFPVFILYFKPSIFRCIVLRWVRGLGFAIVYGTIALKLYRVLKVFLSRTAQRVPYMSSGRVLKMLGLILLLVLWFLAAWTVGMLENVDRNIPLVIRSQTARGLQFHLCGHDRWDYMMVIAEMLFLLWGSFLCFATRSVPSAFHEPRYLGIALHNELLVSAAFHVARFVLVPSLHPDWTLLLFFAHTHATVTMTLVLLFVPKLLRAGSPLREEIAAEVYEDELDARRSGSYLNSSIASAWSERSLDPDDIREELKKLYAQLEAHRTRRMAASNPHLAKKRGSRRSLGRCALRRPAGPPEAERDGAEPAGRGGRGGGSLRLREGSRRRRATSLRKSRSAEDHARPPASPARKTAAAVKASEPSDSESLEAAPLVCKSASAQELAAAGRPRRAPVRKALSLAAGAGHEAALPAGPAAREKPARQERPGAPRDPGPPGGGGGGGSPRRGRARRHVTYAPVKSASADGALRPGRVRVAVRRTPPVPPARLQSLAPPAPPPAPAPGSSAPASPPRPREETCSGEQQAAGAAGSGTPRGASGPGTSAPRASLRSLGLALKAFSRSGGRRGGKGRGGGDGGSGGETPWAAAAASLGGPGPREEAGTAVQSAVLGGSGGDGSPARENAGDARGKLTEEPGPASCGALRLARHEAPGPRTVPAPGSSREAAEPPRGATGPDRRDAPVEAAEEPEAEARPGEAPGAPPGRGSLFRQEAIASPEARGPSPAKVPEPVCPWESQDAADPAARRGTPSPEPRGSGAGRAGSGESRKAEVCPWEAAAGGGGGGAAACPGDAGEVQPESERLERDRTRLSEWAKSIRPKSLGVLRAREGGSSRPAPGRPRGSASAEAASPAAAPRSPERPRTTWRGPEGAGSAKVLVCPWETDGDKAEICPWEASAALSDAAKLQDGQSETCGAGKGVFPRGAAPRDTSDAPKVAEKGSSRRESARAGAEGAGAGLAAESPGELPSTGAAGSTESGAAAGRPRGAEDEPPATAETSPGGAAAAPAGRERATSGISQGGNLPGSGGIDATEANLAGKGTCPWEASEALPKTEGKEKEKEPADKRTTRPAAFASPGKALERGSGERAAVCPWESPGSAQPAAAPRAGSPALPGPPSRASQSPGSLKAEVCPWETREREDGKAEICPWEVAAPPSDHGRAKQVPGRASKGDKRITRQAAFASPAKSLEGGSGERAAVCPGESPGSGQPAAGSLKAEVCPWEAQEGEGGSKAEICPWELAAPPPAREKLSRAEGGLPAGSKSTSPNQSVFKESTSEKEKGSRARGSVCPWESAGTEGASAVEGWKAASRKSESAGSLKAEVCPWESPDTEEPAAQPSRKPGSQRADVCPWETAGAAAGVRSDVCPWEGMGVPLDEPGREVPQRARAAGAFARLEFGSSQRESVCPWESMGAEEPSLKNGTGKGPSKGSKSTESRKSDICPWEEATEPKAVEKASVKADARPRGAVPASPAKAGKPVPGAGATSPTAPLKKSKGKAASEAEHKPLCRILPGVQPPRGPGRGSSPRAASLPASGSRSAGAATVCPWEAEAAPPGPDKPSRGSSKPSAACPREAESADPIPARRGQGRAGESPGHGGGGAAQTDPDVCPWDHE